MKKQNTIQSKFKALKKKHSLSFSDQHTYDEKWNFKVSTLNLLSLLLLYSIFIFFGCVILIKYTPLKYLVTDNTNLYEISKTLESNNTKIDSLEKTILSNDLYFKNLQSILKNEDKLDTTNLNQNLLEENFQPNFTKTTEDSLLRTIIENNQYSINSSSNSVIEIEFYIPPVKGIISKSYNDKTAHFGVDIVGEKDSPVKATLAGIVLFSNWTTAYGYVIILQHDNNLISIYKHNSILLKTEGDRVEAGDPIAIIGNSGEFTDGPHLHFELWQNQKSINPQEFMSF